VTRKPSLLKVGYWPLFVAW